MEIASSSASRVLSAITGGKSVIAFLFSEVDSDYPNIYVRLPSIEEAIAIDKLIDLESDWELDIEESIIDTYVQGDLEKEWLLSDAPAGMIPTICATILNLALPSTAEELDMLLGLTRGNATVYQQIKSLCSMNGNSSKSMQGMDIYQLLAMAVESETALIRQGILEKGFEITRKNKKKKGGPIDFEEENKRLAAL